MLLLVFVLFICTNLSFSVIDGRTHRVSHSHIQISKDPGSMQAGLLAISTRVLIYYQVPLLGCLFRFTYFTFYPSAEVSIYIGSR